MYKRYGFVGSIKLFFSLIYTKVFFNNARLIRLPFDIRNQHLIDLGTGLTTGFGCRIEAHPIQENSKSICIVFGENVQMNDYVHIAASEKITIGNNVLFASKIFISDLNHGNYSSNCHQDSPDTPPANRTLSAKQVVIADNVWVGESVSILSGVTIGRGSIIGCNSVVTKDIPANCIAVGNPAKAIKKFNFETQIWEKII
jgi:acetyltransferase-like isoleucine patch superfamily enzyme